MKITYISTSNTYGDISIGDCFQIPDDEAHCLYIKTPTMKHRNCEVNALNLCDMYKDIFLGMDDVIIPVKTELKVFIN